jgi:hypothetical protein
MCGIYARSGVYARLAYVWDLCKIRCLCEISLSRGCPWWLYICSQLGFTSSFCLLLQVEVLGLVGFMYPSSGLLPWQEPGRLISRTRGVIPSSSGMFLLHLRWWVLAAWRSRVSAADACCWMCVGRGCCPASWCFDERPSKVNVWTPIVKMVRLRTMAAFSRSCVMVCAEVSDRFMLSSLGSLVRLLIFRWCA